MKKHFTIELLNFVFLTVVLSIGICASRVQAATIYVATNGLDAVTSGSSSTPCKTIEYAVEQRAKAGDLVMVDDGTYSENQIDLPIGVSLTAKNQNYPYPTVKIIAKGSVNALLALKSSAITDGNQDISYLDISGVGGVRFGIELVDRNNVHIHHCRLHDRIDSSVYTRAISAVSSEVGAIPANDWPIYLPLDGRDINAWHAKWTFKMIENIEIDHVTIIDWGRVPVDKKAGPGGIRPAGWKNGSIHDSYFEATKPEYFIKFIQATGGYLENVRIYNNTIRSHNTGSEGSVWSVEIWMHINTKLYNNDVNLPFSWTYGYGSEVFNNTIIAEDYVSVGIEGIGQSNYKVYNNFISCGADGGMNFGVTSSVEHILGNVEAYGNVIEKVWYKPWGVASTTSHYGDPPNKTRHELYNIHIHHNTANRISHYGMYLYLENEMDGVMIADGIEFRNNIVTNAIEGAGRFINKGTTVVRNLVIDGNMYYNCVPNAMSGITETNINVLDPRYTADVSALPYGGIRVKDNVNDYRLQSVSLAVNTAKDLGYSGKVDIWNNSFDATPNYGAHQGDGDLPVNLPPTAPGGLTAK